ncbi:MAG TPA: CRTAC1 family protein [Candidatus Saccharimonadales bacterium]|nr:CRTAC1 family protein [Candidatus Saccharimonadales bacterium]
MPEKLREAVGSFISYHFLVLGMAFVYLASPYAGAQEPAERMTSPTSSVQSETRAERPAFTDVTELLGIRFEYLASHTSRKYLIETMGSGVALFDYDNDGRLDIFVVNGASLDDPTPKGTIPQKKSAKESNRLYHQKIDGTFEDVTMKAGLPGAGYGMGVAAGDYDNDGFADLYVTAYGGNRLYHNNGDGTFTDVTQKANVAGDGWSTSAAWIDLDGDGLLDLVVLRYMQWDFDDVWCGERKEGHRAYCHPDAFPAIAPLVYHNDGNGHFTEVAKKLGLAQPGKGLGIAFADYDRDGRIDLFFANDSMPEFLYHNKGGQFEEVALSAGVAVDGEGHSYAGMGVDFADYNNDGLPDLLVTALASQMYAVYRNRGDGTFAYESYPSGIGRLSMKHSGWGVRFIDFDNDGWKDLLITQGHDLDTIEMTSPEMRYKEPNLLVKNTGKDFVDVSSQAGDVFQRVWVGRGLAIGDIDNDGRLDAVVTTNDGGLHILKNETRTKNHWLTLKLRGHKSNRDGIGAEIKLVTGNGAQWTTVTTAGSYLSSSDKRTHFGLGSESIAEQIEILWPSGIRQSLKNIRADQILNVEEPDSQ